LNPKPSSSKRPSVPFSLWLGKWNFAVWVSFIVWAEYFTLGAKPSAIKTILPCFAYSALLTGLILAAIPYLDFLPSLRTHGDLAIMLALFVGMSAVVYSMKWFTVLQEGSLPFFNGISMALAVYFSGSFPQVVTGGAAPNGCASSRTRSSASCFQPRPAISTIRRPPRAPSAWRWSPPAAMAAG